MISRQTNYLKGAITKMKRLFASVCNFMCSDSFHDLLWLDGVCDHNYGSS